MSNRRSILHICKKSMGIFILTPSLVLSIPAAAEDDCTFPNYTISVPATIKYDLTSDSYPQMLSSTWHYSNAGPGFKCTSGLTVGAEYRKILNNRAANTGKTMVFSGKTHAIYDTGVKGVGVIMGAAEGSGNFIPFENTEITVGSGAINLPFSGDPKFAIRYVLTERLSSGTIAVPSKPVMRYGFFAGGSGGYHGWSTATMQSTNIIVSYPGCSLKTPNSVTLPRMDASQLKATGGYSGTTPFTLTLTCLAGVNASYSMTDITDNGNRSSVLGLLQDAGSAKGIGLQIVDDGEPVTLGEDSVSPSAVNKHSFGLVPSGGIISKTFSVRYIKASDSLTPGKVSSGVTVSMSYK